jgi:two-component system, chemotaxis family, chemotaxis protein CheY
MASPGIILIVEDSEPCITTLEMALLGLGALETRTARTGKEALSILATSPVRAIVTDLQLPTMDGFELIEFVRHSSQSALPILVTSGDSDPGNSERLRRLGANAYFVKPYSPAALRRTLEQLLHAS